MPIEEMAAIELEMTKANEITGKLKINRKSNEPENYLNHLFKANYLIIFANR